MNDGDFEGSLVLERLAAIGCVDAFYDAVDSDDFQMATLLMKKAGVESETIRMVLAKMSEDQE